ncbi:hypothetical protein BELL_0199g00100 [Botrytis elliptica]|uniref:Uncharacterized protein n=1 Tax=Botrytis elliptica TaxID=278938 RepID=A0A4Z1JQN8_9HELO|nr:hypothetical protein BELL_0199g00100 [Botrytis elliptica]
MPGLTETNDDNVIFETGKSETEQPALQHEIAKDHFKNLVKAPIDLSKPGLKILHHAPSDDKFPILISHNHPNKNNT